MCWSGSFYPQPLMNWRRKSTLGFGIDFPTLNILGFAAYTISTAATLWSPTIRAQYAARYPVAPEPTVRFNDFAFALHAIILSIIIYSQFWLKAWGFKVGADQKMSSMAKGIFWGNILGVLFVILMVLAKGKDGGNDASGWAWIDVVRCPECPSCPVYRAQRVPWHPHTPSGSLETFVETRFSRLVYSCV